MEVRYDQTRGSIGAGKAETVAPGNLAGAENENELELLSFRTTSTEGFQESKSSARTCQEVMKQEYLRLIVWEGRGRAVRVEKKNQKNKWASELKFVGMGW